MQLNFSIHCDSELSAVIATKVTECEEIILGLAALPGLPGQSPARPHRRYTHHRMEWRSWKHKLHLLGKHRCCGLLLDQIVPPINF